MTYVDRLAGNRSRPERGLRVTAPPSAGGRASSASLAERSSNQLGLLLSLPPPTLSPSHQHVARSSSLASSRLVRSAADAALAASSLASDRRPSTARDQYARARPPAPVPLLAAAPEPPPRTLRDVRRDQGLGTHQGLWPGHHRLHDVRGRRPGQARGRPAGPGRGRRARRRAGLATSG